MSRRTNMSIRRPGCCGEKGQGCEDEAGRQDWGRGGSTVGHHEDDGAGWVVYGLGPVVVVDRGSVCQGCGITVMGQWD